MSSYSVDKVTGKVIIRAYAGIDKRTRKKRNLSKILPAGVTQAEIDEACAALDAKAKEVKQMGFSSDVASMFERYIAICKATGYANSTLLSYRSNLRCYVVPYIGSAQLTDLRPWIMSEMFLELAKSGKIDGTPLARKTLAKLYSWLNAAFKWFVGEGHIAVNPMEGCKRIYPDRTEAEPINDFDLRKIYAWLAKDAKDWEELTFKKIVWLDLGTGLRRGEISGLQVADLRYLAKDLSIARSATEAGGFHYKHPKSKTSVRRVSINEGVVSELQQYIDAQRDMLAANDMDQAATSPMFCHENGRPWKPSELTIAFGQLRNELKLSHGVHFHSMRHTHASQLLGRGIDIRTLQERLGHASVNTTLSIYGHVLPGRDRAAADSWEDYAKGFVNGT